MCADREGIYIVMYSILTVTLTVSVYTMGVAVEGGGVLCSTQQQTLFCTVPLKKGSFEPSVCLIFLQNKGSLLGFVDLTVN